MFNNILFLENASQTQLTQEELLNISQNTSREIAPSQTVQTLKNKTDQLLTRQQLLEVSQNLSRYYAPRISSNTHTLILLPIDPKNFYVYWNLADYHQYSDPHRHQDYDLKLRVFSQFKEYHTNKKAKLVYEISVSAIQSRQKINLQNMEQGVVYTASLGKSLSEDRFIALVNSNEFYSLYDTKNHNHYEDSSTETDLSKDSNSIENIHSITDKNKLRAEKSNFASPNFSAQGINN